MPRKWTVDNLELKLPLSAQKLKLTRFEFADTLAVVQEINRVDEKGLTRRIKTRLDLSGRCHPALVLHAG